MARRTKEFLLERLPGLCSLLVHGTCVCVRMCVCVHMHVHMCA